MTLTQTKKRNLQIFKNELGYSRIEHLLSIYYEDQLRKEVSNIFQEMRYEVVKNLAEYYNPEIMVNAQMDLILAPIQEAHKKYYETLLKYKIREFDKSRQQGKRIVERMLNFKRKGNVPTKRFVVLKADINDAVSSTISKDKLFGTSDVAHDNLAQRTYQLSEGTLSRVDKDINQIITKGYDEGHGIDTVSHNVTTRFNQLESWEAVRIARTEIHNSHSLGLIQGYDDMDVEYIQWSCSIDGRQRDSHELLHGEIIPLGGVFSNGLMYPGDMLGSAEEVINCRCQALPFIMPFGYIAPPGMAQFREDDLISMDVPDFDELISEAQSQLQSQFFDESSFIVDTVSSRSVGIRPSGATEYGGELEIKQIELEIDNFMGVDDLNSEEAYYLQEYGDVLSKPLNEALWEDREYEYEEVVEILDELMDDTPGLAQDTVLFAGMPIDETLEIGEIGNLKGYQSTSFFEDVANEFAGDYDDRWVVKIYAKKGQKGKCLNGLGGEGLSSYVNEHEYLLPRNTKYKLINKYIDSSGRPVAEILLL